MSSTSQSTTASPPPWQKTTSPKTFTEPRASCRVRARILYQYLAAGTVTKSANGYSLAAR